MAAKRNAPLQDAAATAALYVTKGQKKPAHPVLDEDGKLSSASAATSLKYAKASDLPSFPSTGGVKLSSAGAAASLANSNQKAFEHWKPGALPAAEKAAYLARDYQPDPLWQPELSKAGSKAAILAAQDGGNVEIWLPTESEYGQSAAGQAVNMKSTSPVVSKKVPDDAHRKALMAATGAMSGSRRRSDSMPTKPTDSESPWALKAATTSHRGAAKESNQMSDPAVEASRLTHMAKNNVSRAMYSSNPPVSIEVEEKNRQDTLRASAVAMAQKMYAIQQNAIDQAKKDEQGLSHTGSRAAVKSHHRRMSTTSSIGSDDNVTAYPQYSNLQEAATRLAQERLSKLENEHKAYRDYYGQGTPNRSRLSRTLRRRASSDGQLDKVDEEQSRKIRSQMSIFKSRVEEVDERKRQKDREALMAAAQKKVSANMSAMDEKVFNETGKASPAMMKQWEEKARQRAEADSAVRMENYGKVDIGGGKYMDQAAVEAVARSRLQPTFDDITEKAEAQRARDEEIRLEQEERKRKADTEQLREAELKSAMKVAKDQEKDEERAKKAEEKRLHEQEKQEKRLTKEERRKSKSETKHRSFGAILGLGGAKAETDDTLATNDRVEAVETAPVAEPISEAEPVAASVQSAKHEDGTQFGAHAATTVPRVDSGPSEGPSEVVSEVPSNRERPTSSSQPPASPTKQSWFSRHFKRGSKSKSADGPGSFSSAGMAGRATSHSDSSLSDEDSRAEASMRDVAMAGRSASDKEEKTPAAPTAADDDMYEASTGITSDRAHAHASAPRNHSPSISSLSDEGEVDTHHAATVSASASATGGSSGNRRSIGGLKDRLLAKIQTKDSDNSSANDDDAFEDTVEQHQGEPSMDASAPSPVTGTGTTDKGKGVSKFSENI